MEEQPLRLGHILGLAVLGPAGQEHGRVVDVVVHLADEGRAPVAGLLVADGHAELFAPVRRLELGGDRVRYTADTPLEPFRRRPAELLARRDLLGHPLIYFDAEAHRARLVRACDLLLADRDGWRVVAVDTASSGGWRRLLGRHATPALLDWECVEPFVSHVPTALLRVRLRRLAQLHPAAIADLVESAPDEESRELMTAVGENVELEADVLEELDRDHQVEFLVQRSDAEVARLLAAMPADDAADLLERLPQERRLLVLGLLPTSLQQTVRALLGYNPETAGGLMSPAVVAVPATFTVAEALDRVRAAADVPAEALSTVYTLDAEGRLTGAVAVVELLRSPTVVPLADLARIDPPRLHTSADIPEIATVMSDFNLAALAVVDDAEQVVGVITVDDVLELLIPESWRRRREAAEAV